MFDFVLIGFTYVDCTYFRVFCALPLRVFTFCWVGGLFRLIAFC